MLKKHLPDNQDDLFKSRLDQIINMKHELVILSKIIDWDSFDGDFKYCYCDDNGRTAKPIRLKVGLTILQSIYNLSDEAVVADWVRDPYFQYFCGEEFFCHDFPIDPTGLTSFRQKIGEDGMNNILQETIRIGSGLKLIKNKKDLTEITIDSTTQEKNITYPTDSRLYNKARKAVVKLANDDNVTLRQNYNLLAKRALFMRGLYQRKRKSKLAKKQDRKLQTYLRRVIADYERKANSNQLQESQRIVNRAKAILNQKISDKNKIYSWHEDNITCFSKGKMYKKYEFGSKATIAATNKSNFILSIVTEGQNRHDSKILSDSIQKTQQNINQEIQKVFLDKGYRGNNYPHKEKLFISGQKKLSITPTIRKKIKRRNSIEQINSVLKNYHRLNKSFLKGEIGDQINANMAGLGYNFKRILQQIVKFLFVYILYQEIQMKIQKFLQKIKKSIRLLGEIFCGKWVLQG